LLFFFFFNAQVTLDIGSTETFYLSSNSQLTVDGITYTPSANNTLSNVTFSKATSTANTSSINNIQKVISIANSWTNFSGSIRFTYLTSELNGLNESDLNISSFDGSTWTPLTATTVTTATNVASANLTATNISELTLQISATTTSTTTSTTVTPTSSGGGGGGGSSNPSVDPNDTDGDGIANALDTFPNDPNEWEDTDGDGIGNNGDPDDDNDGVYDFFESEYITIYKTLFISITTTNTNKNLNIPDILPSDKGVGKWKIRKKIVGGADADKFIISGGDPASQGILQQQKNSNLPEGVLKFKTMPDFNNPADNNRDNIYEVEIAFINTTANDKRVPVPPFDLNISFSDLSSSVVTLITNPVDISVFDIDDIKSDTDGDKFENPFDIDDDADGILSNLERNDPNFDGSDEDAQDTDGDGFADFLDPDDDNDGVFSLFEGTDPDGDFDPADAIDSDGDGTPDYLDSDDDGDGIDSVNENPDQDQDGNPSDALDFDGDGTPDYLDTDDDNDGLLTINEGLKDTDRDGTPDFHDTDDDNDGVPTLFELDGSGNPLDTDGDGVIDAIDSDDDGDGLLTTDEDVNSNGDPRDDDTDNDGTPNYLESSLLDQDEDGVVDELDTVDDDPYNDQDGDGYPNLDEVLAGTNPLDSNSFPQGFDNPSLRASIDIVSFFSPNSDGVNDTWQIKEIDRYPNNQVWIFTRTGYEVFNTLNYRNDWSGTKDGTPLPAGSYYYRIDLDGNDTIDFEGWLYLTR